MMRRAKISDCTWIMAAGLQLHEASLSVHSGRRCVYSCAQLIPPTSSGSPAHTPVSSQPACQRCPAVKVPSCGALTWQRFLVSAEALLLQEPALASAAYLASRHALSMGRTRRCVHMHLLSREHGGHEECNTGICDSSCFARSAPTYAACRSGALSCWTAGMGVITAVGEGVSAFQPGQRVVGMPWGNKAGDGSWQQYAVVRESAVVAVPDAVTDEAAAQYAINPMTAYGLIDVSH